VEFKQFNFPKDITFSEGWIDTFDKDINEVTKNLVKYWEAYSDKFTLEITLTGVTMYFLDPSGNPDLYKTKILNYFKQFEMIKGHELTYDTKSKILAKLIKSEFELKFNEWLH